MITVRQAIKRAADEFQAVFSEADPQTVRLEEVELSEDDKHWSITFSFRTFPKSGATISEGLFSSERQYKTVRLDAETGEVKSIKIRVLA